MTILGYIGWGVAVLAIAYCLRVYYELWKWARICQSARIAVSYKRKVKLQAPLTEWIAWIRLLDKDKDSAGRVIFSQAGVAIAITRADALLNVRFREFIRIRRARWYHKRHPAKANRLGGAIEGTWSATDQTPKENRATSKA